MASKSLAQARGASRTTASRQRGPQVNLFDIPEMMPGAQPSANPAQREEFEQRCRALHREAEEEAREATANRAAAAASTVTEMEAMFPFLDAALVRTLCAEARTPQLALDTLLALSAATTEGVTGPAPTAPPVPPRNLGVEDHSKFPALGGGPAPPAAAKEAASCEATEPGKPPQEEPEEEEDSGGGSAWRDLARAAASKPAPRAAPASAVAPARRRRGRAKEEDEPPQFLTDYEVRHRHGQRRAQQRKQHGRGRGGGPARGGAQAAAAPGGTGAGDGSGSAGSEDEWAGISVGQVDARDGAEEKLGFAPAEAEVEGWTWLESGPQQVLVPSMRA